VHLSRVGNLRTGFAGLRKKLAPGRLDQRWRRLTFGDTIKNIWVVNIGLIDGDPAPDLSQGRPALTSAAALARGALIFWAAERNLPSVLYFSSK
jgi:hypothetical protein